MAFSKQSTIKSKEIKVNDKSSVKSDMKYQFPDSPNTIDSPKYSEDKEFDFESEPLDLRKDCGKP